MVQTGMKQNSMKKNKHKAVKIYRVIDNGLLVMTTVDELKAFREYYRRIQKRQEVADWGWIDTEEIE